MRTEKEYFQGHDVGQEHKRVAEDPWRCFFWGLMRQGASCKTFSNGPAQRSSPSVTLGDVGFGMVIRNSSSLEGNYFCPPMFSVVLPLDAVLVMRSPNTIQRHIHLMNLLINALFPKHQGCSDFLYGSLCLRQASALLVQSQVWLTRRTWTCHWMLMWGFVQMVPWASRQTSPQSLCARHGHSGQCGAHSHQSGQFGAGGSKQCYLDSNT